LKPIRGFSRRGFERANLKQFGTKADLIDKFTIFVIAGSKTDRHSFRTWAGTGSRSHDFILEEPRRLDNIAITLT